jgi:inhibitor of KinA sporulation pathway (predicted exonuclease)
MVYFCVIDFETTCWKKNNIENEIIEFPSILVEYDNITSTILGNFHQYVKPTMHTELSDYCKKITGIKQITINHSKILHDVLHDHIEWLRKITNFDDKIIFVTCGDFDFQYQLTNELKIKNIIMDDIYKKYINIKDDFEKFYGTRAKSMKHMLEYLGLPFIGKHHFGMNDTENITNILCQMIQEGYNNFSIISYE